MTIQELKEALDWYGDHLQVRILREGQEVDLYYEVEEVRHESPRTIPDGLSSVVLAVGRKVVDG